MTRPDRVVTIDTMPKYTTMSELLREALSNVDSIRGVARATGLDHASLVRFISKERSLRLDKAEKLAAHFGIECRVTSRRRKG